MKRLGWIFGIILLCSLTGQEAWAGTAYVTDSFQITLRSGPSTDNKIIMMPSSGQAMEVLEEQKDWSRVRLLPDGDNPREGWVLNRYLIFRQPWEIQTRNLRQKNDELTEKYNEMKKQLEETLSEKRSLTGSLDQNTEAFQRLQKQYDTLKQGAEGFLKLESSFEAAKKSLKTATNELQRLEQENEELRSSQMNRWFATGALVLLCGLLIGLLVGRQQKKRRSVYE
ncbi:MAG: TIGR04211 family SH3 domain-containing protein [Desulfatiglandales bacterium]